MRVLRFLGRLLLAFVKLSLLALILLAIVAFVIYQTYVRELLADLPDPEVIGQRRPAETTQIYARDGQTLLYELVDPQGGRRTVVPFDEIPQILKDATIAVEDAGFYENPGVDLRGIVRAVWLNYQAQEVVSGGSTITQQLVRNVLMTPEERTSVSVERKIREAILAYNVSRQYSKEQILSIYLNEVYYGNQAYGVEAAAQAYFGKHVWELTDAEATLIAGLPQSPTNLDPFTNLEGAKERQKVTLDLMARFGYLTRQEADALYAMPVQLTPQTTDVMMPHFVFYIRQLLEQQYGPDKLYRGGLRVVTTLDMYWQVQAERIVRERVAELRERDATNASVIMLSPDNHIMAMVGSADYNDPSIDGKVNVALSLQQPGSALKPIVYATAMQRDWTPATVIWDEPTEFVSADNVVYAPRNYDNAWHGPQRLRMSLANSLNIPAVKALEYVGVESFVEQAHALGITTLNNPDQYGLPMALGANEVRLIDLTNAYSSFQNGGRKRDPIGILKVTDSRGAVLESNSTDPGKQVLGTNGPQIAYLITNILSDNIARQYMFGFGNVMELPDERPAAVKTGTSNDWRDSWAVGYTPDITVGVWVGNTDNTPMDEVAGSNGAGVIWQDIMATYHEGRPIRDFEQPTGISEVAICTDTGSLASDACPRTTDEVFVAGTEPQTSDVQFQEVRVAQDGTCLPASYTLPSEIEEETYIVYPPAFREWAIGVGIPQPPTDICPPSDDPEGNLALISEPEESTTITDTQVFIRGIARGPYLLEFGEGRDPEEWEEITRNSVSVNDNVLGVWRTDELSPGEYTLRLQVTVGSSRPAENQLIVRIARE